MAVSLSDASPDNMDGWVSRMYSLQSRSPPAPVSSADLNLWQGLAPRCSEEANSLGIACQLMQYVESHPQSQVTLEDGTVYTIREPIVPSDASLATLTAEGKEDFLRNFHKRGWGVPEAETAW